MTDTTTAQSTQDADSEPRFYVGSYVLETLTTGMYTEPRDCIREYVQNGLDAIDAARQAKLIGSHEGEVKLTVSSNDNGTITVRDNGASIPAERVWETLTSIGASRKNARRHAGFRGIGRLAGIAYCDQLEFACKAAGEKNISIVTYDCKAIKKALRDGGSELEPVFKRSISTREEPTTNTGQHFTQVRLVGIGDAPKELRDAGSLAEYLTSVAPIEFRDSWAPAAEIKRTAEAAGFLIPTIKLMIGVDGVNFDEIRKPYTQATTANKKIAPIRKIEYFPGGSHLGTKWWGWYGELPLYGTINDLNVAGIRIRVKNIQLDGAEIISRILQKHASSYARFASWHLGEIHIEGDTVFPNARRDGFEDSAAWRVVEGQIAEGLKPLVSAAYGASGKRSSKDFKKVNEDTQREIEEIKTSLAKKDDPTVSTDQKALSRKIRSALKRVENLGSEDYTEKEQRTLREAAVQLRDLAEKASVTIRTPKPKPEPERETELEDIPYSDFLDIVFEVLNPLLDTRTFNKVRKALIERFKDP